MPVVVDPDLCNGCYTSRQPPCVRMCPGDLIVKDFHTNKAYLKYVEDCWDCLPCVKACPEEAIRFQLSYQMGFYNASLQPHIHKDRQHITWKLVHPDNTHEEFTIRTKVLEVALDEKVEGEPAPDFSI